MAQLMQVLGAVMIVTAFVLAQMKILGQHSYTYLLLNLVGSAILAVDAFEDSDWGFVLLEVVWAAVSGWSLVMKATGRLEPELS